MSNVSSGDLGSRTLYVLLTLDGRLSQYEIGTQAPIGQALPASKSPNHQPLESAA